MISPLYTTSVYFSKMSLIADLLSVEDTLGNLRLKPWWETCREYCFKGSLAVVFVSAFFPLMEFNCLPKSDVENEPLVLDGSQFDTVNSYCNYMSVPWHIRYGDLIAFVASIITFIATNYWTHASGVKKELNDISQIGRSILELNITAVEMQNSCVIPITADSKDKHRILRRNIQVLFRHGGYSTSDQPDNASIWVVYSRRCSVVLAWTMVFSVLVLHASLGQAPSVNLIVTCVIPNELLQLRAGNSSNTLTCVDKTSSFIGLLQLGFGVFVAMQSIAMAVALYSLVQARRRYKEIFSSRDIEIVMDSFCTLRRNSLTRRIIFLIVMMGIDEGQAGNIFSFCDFVTRSPIFVNKMLEDADTAIVAHDMEYFRILKSRMASDEMFWDCVIGSCDNVLCDGENNTKNNTDAEPLDADFIVFQCLEGISGRIDHETDGDIVGEREIGEIGDKLIETKNWRLFYCSLSYRRYSYRGVLLNQLDNNGRNILYYMLRNSTMNRLLGRFLIFNDFLKKLKSKGKLIVHFDGKSIPAEQFFHSEFPGHFRGVMPNFRLIESSDEIDDCKDNLADVSQFYVKQTGSPSQAYEIETGENDCLPRLNSLKLLSITQSADARTIVGKAVSNEHWEVIVALLNTLIVVHSQGARPADHELMGNDWFKLRDTGKLSQIFQEALKRPREKVYYVATAAEHILSIMDDKERNASFGCIDDVALPGETKEYLRDFIRKRNDGGTK